LPDEPRRAVRRGVRPGSRVEETTTTDEGGSIGYFGGVRHLGVTNYSGPAILVDSSDLQGQPADLLDSEVLKRPYEMDDEDIRWSLFRVR
jgi:hypothetical protein